MAELSVNDLGRTIMWIIGVLVTVLGFSKLLMEVVFKPYNKYQNENKQAYDNKSHEPLKSEMKQLHDSILELSEDLRRMEKVQKTHRKATVLTAKALLSLVSDLTIKGSPNGNTQIDLGKLRDHLYDTTDEEIT